MKEFLMLLFFHKTLLLTPVPIELAAGVEHRIQGSVSAINAEASFQVQIPLLPPKASELPDFERKLRVTYPPGTIEVVASTKAGQSIRFTNRETFTYSTDDVRLIITSASPVPTDTSLERITIRATMAIPGTRVYWENGKV